MYRFGWAAALPVVIFAILFLFAQLLFRRTRATELVLLRTCFYHRFVAFLLTRFLGRDELQLRRMDVL
jgi:hypothetical protein